LVADAYNKAMLGTVIVPPTAATPIVQTGLPFTLARLALRAIRTLLDARDQSSESALRDLASQIAKALLDAMAEGFDEASQGWDGKWQPGVFSGLRLAELTPLAMRTPAMIKRYGEKHVEKRFESQLALLFQSLGYIVIQTRTGHRTVDLVCISTDPSDRLTFLVEAKTTAGRYALPAKDERALRDYIEDINATLGSLPPLKFVMLVSHAGTKTLEGKLQELERKSETPTRFVATKTLAELREELPGPAPTGMLVKLLLKSPHVVAEDLAAAVASSYSQMHRAHQDFAEALMKAARPIG